jgi:hypothetical protein
MAFLTPWSSVSSINCIHFFLLLVPDMSNALWNDYKTFIRKPRAISRDVIMRGPLTRRLGLIARKKSNLMNYPGETTWGMDLRKIWIFADLSHDLSDTILIRQAADRGDSLASMFDGCPGWNTCGFSLVRCGTCGINKGLNSPDEAIRLVEICLISSLICLHEGVRHNAPGYTEAQMINLGWVMFRNNRRPNSRYDRVINFFPIMMAGSGLKPTLRSDAFPISA